MSRPRVWVHGSSLGDINALTALIESLEARGCELTLSASTSSGRARIAQRFPQLTARRAPLWSQRSARRALCERGAQLLILETLEWWPAWLSVWGRAGVRVIIVDGRVSPRTLWARPLLMRCAERVTWFLAQTREDAERARSLGVSPYALAVCGDAKIDSALSSFERALHINETAHQLETPLKTPLVLSCLRPRDEKPALKALLSHHRSLTRQVILVAPRHIERAAHLTRRAAQLGFTVYLASRLGHHQELHLDESAPTLLVLDRYGDLAWRYRFAQSVIMGGTFYDRGQGLIEPALAGCAVIYGGRGRAAASQRVALQGAGGHQVSSWEEAIELSVELNARPRAEIGAPRGVFNQLRGALERQLAYIERTLNEST